MENKLDELENQFLDYLAEEILEKLKNNKIYSVWLSYDLGLDEKAKKVTEKEYDELYQKRYKPLLGWLKDRSAHECGKSVATFIAKASDVQSLISALKYELKTIGIVEKGVRIYVVISDLADFTGKQCDFELNKIRFAGFIIGERESAAWDEYKKPGVESVDIKP